MSDLSDANGWARLEFTLSGVSVGDVVQLSLEAVSPERGVCAGGARNVWNPLGEPFPAGWSFSDTRDDLRASAYEL